MRLLGRMEIANGECHVAKHVPGVENELTEGISQLSEKAVFESVQILTQDEGWHGWDTGTAEILTLEHPLQPQFPNEKMHNALRDVTDNWKLN